MVNKCILCNSNNIYEKCNLVTIADNCYIVYNTTHYKVLNSIFVRKDFNYELLNGYTYKYTMLNLHENKKIYLEINTRIDNMVDKYIINNKDF